MLRRVLRVGGMAAAAALAACVPSNWLSGDYAFTPKAVFYAGIPSDGRSSNVAQVFFTDALVNCNTLYTNVPGWTRTVLLEAFDFDGGISAGRTYGIVPYPSTAMVATAVLMDQSAASRFPIRTEPSPSTPLVLSSWPDLLRHVGGQHEQDVLAVRRLSDGHELQPLRAIGSRPGR